MRAVITVRVNGLRELDAALAGLPAATGKAVLRRVGIKALAPVISVAKSLVPVDTGALKASLKVSTKLSRTQKRKQARAIATGKSAVNLHAGASALPHAHLVEFGTVRQAPRPFFRPAWDQTKMQVLGIIRAELGGEIDKTARRLAARAARKALGK